MSEDLFDELQGPVLGHLLRLNQGQAIVTDPGPVDSPRHDPLAQLALGRRPLGVPAQIAQRYWYSVMKA